MKGFAPGECASKRGTDRGYHEQASFGALAPGPVEKPLLLTSKGLYIKTKTKIKTKIKTKMVLIFGPNSRPLIFVYIKPIISKN